MYEDTLSVDIRLSSDLAVESSATATNSVTEAPRQRATRTWPRYRRIFPLTLSMLFSVSAPGVGRRDFLLNQESSVILSRQRPTRRRVTLAQARQFALQALYVAEAARARFAELDAAYFSNLYEWSER